MSVPRMGRLEPLAIDITLPCQTISYSRKFARLTFLEPTLCAFGHPSHSLSSKLQGKNGICIAEIPALELII